MTCSKCECLVRVKNKLGYNLYYCGYKKYGALKALSGLYINNEEYRKNNKTCKYYKGVRPMTEEEKAVKYCYENVTIYEAEKHNKLANKVKQAYLDGLAEGRKDRNCVNCSNHGKQFEVMKLEKENAELKAQNKLLSEKESYWEEQSKLKDSQLEEQDRLEIFTVARFDELKAQIEQLKYNLKCRDDELAESKTYIEKMKCCKEDIINSIKSEKADIEWVKAHNGVAKFIYVQTVIDIINDKWELTE